VALDLDMIEDKLVARRRGGYCFEHNLLFMAALQAVGDVDVTPMLARVRQGTKVGVRPLTHLVLRVVAADGTWHADVGFGGDTLLDPLPYGPGVSVEQSGWRYRTVSDAAETVLQIWRDGDWMDLYGFVPDTVEMIDIEVANWYTSTNPRSPFLACVIVGGQQPGHRNVFRATRGAAQLTERTPDSVTVRPVAYRDAADLLARRFGLHDASAALAAHLGSGA